MSGRSPTTRHVLRTHRAALDWLFDRINLDPKVQIKYVESKNQLADIPTKDSFTRDELHLFNIMNDTTFSCSHSFLSTGKQFEMSKRSRESSSPGSPTATAKSMLSRFTTMCICGQDYSSNPKSPGSARDSQVWTWAERSTKSGWYSVQHASGNRETESTREESFKT